MANHYPSVTDMLESIGLPGFVPEPEVTRKAVERAQTKALASMIRRALEEDPLLRVEAEADGTISVRELGGPAAFKITVEPQ